MKGKKMILGIILIAVGIFIDQITKIIAFQNFVKGRVYKGIPGLFRFEIVENPGGAWGVFSDRLWFFILVTLIALVFLAYLSKDFDMKTNPIFSASFILIVIGAIGNFIDRLFNNGLVRDFITFDFIRFPIFNFADMCLSVGVFFMMIDIFFGPTGVKWTKST